jgi:hypothetical protein
MPLVALVFRRLSPQPGARLADLRNDKHRRQGVVAMRQEFYFGQQKLFLRKDCFW